MPAGGLAKAPGDGPPTASAGANPRHDLFGHLALVAKAMGHANRLELLDFLAQAERDVESLARLAKLSVANASQHLQLLRRAGLVTARKDGLRVIYRLTGEAVVGMLAALRGVAEANLAEVGQVVAAHFEDKGGLDEITREELLERMRQGVVTVVDVRPVEEFDAGHLPGALNITLDAMAERLGDLDPGREIIAYCRGPYCALAYRAIDAIRGFGHKARRLEDGYPEWKLAGLAVETGD
ncbi:MAG: ArsR/SmtB family transcription factor [Alphaproteobacteria bacterium]